MRRGEKKLSVHHMKSWSIDILHCYSNFPLAKILQNKSSVQKTLLQKEKTVFGSITKGWVQGHLIGNYELYQKVKLWVDLKIREGVCFLTAGSTDEGRESWKFCVLPSLINSRNQKKACSLTAPKIWYLFITFYHAAHHECVALCYLALNTSLSFYCLSWCKMLLSHCWGISLKAKDHRLLAMLKEK